MMPTIAEKDHNGEIWCTHQSIFGYNIHICKIATEVRREEVRKGRREEGEGGRKGRREEGKEG